MPVAATGAGECEEFSAVFDRLRLEPALRLAELISTLDTTRTERLAAGQLLALIGDVRLNVFDPPMIRIPGARMTIGLEPGRETRVARITRESGGDRRPWERKEQPSHQVELCEFWIGRYAVTNFEYAHFVREAGQSFVPKTWAFGKYQNAVANLPVHGIAPAGATAYAVWLSDRTGRHFRLPSEAEWEYAAGGREHREYPWGEEFLPDRANTVESGLLAPTPVGAFPQGASPFGVLDMAGNVEEYVADEYAPYPGGEWVEDDLHQLLGRYRVARGGSYCLLHDMARTRRRHGGPHPRHLCCAIGFRLAEERAID
jgi:toxoflavin biosynthesis protein ToxD